MNCKQLTRFLFFGVINTLFSYGIYVSLLYIGMRYQVANLLALIAGILFSYTTQKKFVFTDGLRGSFFRYVLIWVFQYGINIALIAALIRYPMSSYLAGGIAIFPMTVVSFFLQRYWVFKPKSDSARRQSINESES